MHPSGGPTCLSSPSQSPRSLWEGAGVILMSVCCGLSRGPAPSPFLGSRSENWLWGQTWMRTTTLLSAKALGFSVSFWTLPWLVAHPLSLQRPRCIDHLSCSVGPASRGGVQPSSWPLAPGLPQCNTTSSAAVPRQWRRREGCHPSPSITSPGEPGLCYNVFALLGDRAVGDHLFPVVPGVSCW